MIWNRAVKHPALPLIRVQNGQSDWPKSQLCPKWQILIGQMRFREVATQDLLHCSIGFRLTNIVQRQLAVFWECQI
jgi:hypothetical protein